MAQPFHGLEVGPLDFLGRGIAHLRCCTPVVLACKEVYWALFNIDGRDTVSCVKSTEVEIQITVEDAVRLP